MAYLLFQKVLRHDPAPDDQWLGRVVSMPCQEWFAAQPRSYQDQVLPPAVRARVSVEAAVRQGWREIVGDAGRIVSLDHFGASADYERLYKEFGITAEAAPADGGTGDRPA